MRTLTCKHKIWGQNFIALLLLNVLETWRICKLTINLGIVKFLKIFIKLFCVKSVGVNQIEYKTVKKAAERTPIKFSFLAIGRNI